MLKNHRNEYEYVLPVRLADMRPANVKVCIVADRGVGDRKRYRVLTVELQFDCAIRFRSNSGVTAARSAPPLDGLGRVGGPPPCAVTVTVYPWQDRG